MSAPIISEAIPLARIEKSRVVNEPGFELPRVWLGLGPFFIGRTAAGLPELRDESGAGWGIFANERLARQTAAQLSA